MPRPAKKTATKKPTAVDEAANLAKGARKARKVATSQMLAGVFGRQTIDRSMLLPAGSTVLNLAMSGSVHGGYPTGHVSRVYGESSSGKSLLLCHACAELANDPRFADYKAYYDDPEGGVQFDLEGMFGAKMEARTKFLVSRTVEECYMRIEQACNEGPCLYIVDSLDALSSQEEQKKFGILKDAIEAGSETTGVMSDGKARKNSMLLRQVLGAIEKSKSIVIFVSQVRDKLGSPIPGQISVSGGRAVKFYAALEYQIKGVGGISKSVEGRDRELGITSEVKIVKSRMIGTRGAVKVPILHSHGVDGVMADILWLCEEKVWRIEKGRVQAPQFMVKGKADKAVDLEKLVRFIEQEDTRLAKLQDMVFARWTVIRDAMKAAVTRKKRFA